METSDPNQKHFPSEDIGRTKLPEQRYQYVEIDPDGSDNDGDSDDLERYLQIWRRNRWAIVACGVLGAVIGVASTFLAVPLYLAKTTLEIRGIDLASVGLGGPAPSASANNDRVFADLAVLESWPVREAVKEHLMQRDEPPFKSTPALIEQLNWLGFNMPSRGWSWRESLNMAATTLVAAPAKAVSVIEVSCKAPNPKAASDFLTALTTEFADRSINSRWESSQRTEKWMGRQLEDLQQALVKSEQELQAYVRTSNLEINENGRAAAADRLSQLRQQLFEAQAARLSLQSNYEKIVDGSPEDLLAIVDDASLRAYTMKLSDLGQQMAQLSAALTDSHYKVRRLKAEIEEVKGSYEREKKRIIERTRNDYNSTLRREALLSRAYAEQEGLVDAERRKIIKYNFLKREVDTNRQLYDGLLQKMKETSVASTMLLSNVRVIDPPRLPSVAVTPDPLKYGGLGFAAGFGLAGLFVFVMAQIDGRLRFAGDMRSVLGVRELGMIPSAKFDPGFVESAKAWKISKSKTLGIGSNGSGSNSAAREEPLELVTWQRKQSLLAESFRTTLASVLLSGENGSRPRVIVITSAGPSEGKSAVTSNLAVALTEHYRNVAMVDSDLRNPRLHKIYDIDNSWGLSDILSSNTPIANYPKEALVKPTKIPGLYLLPSGPADLTASGLLFSPRMAELVQRLRTEFDRVAIDTPPFLHVVDARYVAKLSDGVVLVVRARHTLRTEAITARQRLQEDGTPIIGVVLNDWDPADSGTKYYSHYTKYYQQHFVEKA